MHLPYIVRHSQRKFIAFLGIIVAFTLSFTFLQPIAYVQAAPTATIPTNILLERDPGQSYYVGDSYFTKVKVSTQNSFVRATNDYYQAYYVVDLDLQRVIYSQRYGQVKPNDSSTFTLDKEFIPVGVHNYQVFITSETSSSSVLATTLSEINTRPVLGQSNTLTLERKPLVVSLTTKNNTFARTYATVDAKVNQEFNGKYLYVFDLTDGRLLSANAQTSWSPSSDFPWGGPHSYQAFLADWSNDSSITVSQLKNVVAQSNIVSQTRGPWYVEVFNVGSTDLRVTTAFTPPNFANSPTLGGKYASYLVDDATSKVLWTENDANMYYTKDANYTGSATGYIAKPWATYDGGSGVKPQTLADLQDIQADSKGYSKSYTGINDVNSVAGGTNPSENSCQSCAGDPVNTATGEFYLNKTDNKTVGTSLSPINISAFSTMNKDVLGSLGYGWTNNYAMQIASATNDLNLLTSKKLSLKQENSSVTSFDKNSDGSYSSSSNSPVTLSYDASISSFVFTRTKTKDSFTFSSTGNLVSLKNIRGENVTLTYAGSKLSTASDTRGNVLTYAYNPAGLLATVTDQMGRVTSYTYDNAKKLLTNVTDYQGKQATYTYDGSRRVVTLSNALGGVTTNTYNNANQVTQQSDPLGNLLKFSYSGYVLNGATTITYADNSTVTDTYSSGQLIQKTQNIGKPSARSWFYSYGERNQLVSTVNPGGTSTSQLYDDKGNPTTVIDSKGNSTVVTYNEQNKPLSIKNALGQTTTNTYDINGNLLTSTDPLGNKTSFTYNPDGTLASSTDARGNATGANPADYTTVSSYSPQGLRTGSTGPLGGKDSLGLDNIGRTTSMVSPNGNVAGANPLDYTSNLEYNSLDLPSKLTDPKGNETALTYDAMGNVLTSKDALGKVTTNTYDLMGNKLSSTNALNETTSYHYDSMNRVDSVTDPLGKVTSIVYDALGRAIKSTDPLNRVKTQEWDLNDRLVAKIDAAGKRTSYSYDANGNLLSSTDPLGNTTKYTYDAVNRVTATRDAEGKVMSSEYDAAGRLIKTTKPDNSSVTYSYDAVGNKTGQTDELGKQSFWSYDALNRKTSYTDPAGKVTQYSYDANGNLTQEKRPDNSLVKYSYDTANLLTKIDYPGTSEDITYGYDALGRQISEQKGSQAPVELTYDAQGKMLSRGTSSSQVKYEYDNRGNTTKLTYPSGRVVNYSYDAASQLTGLTTAGIANIGYSYDARGLNTQITLPSGVTTDQSFDDAGKLTKIDVKNGGTSLYAKSQTYSPAGNIAQRNVSTDSKSPSSPIEDAFGYDPRDRVTSQTGSTSNAYEYDKVGNLTKNNGVTQSFSDVGNVLSSGSNAYGYDLRGNRVNQSNASEATKNRELTWTSGNLLESVTSHSTVAPSTVGYSYDASGLLSSRNTSGATQGFTWDVSRGIPVMLTDGEYEYVYGAGRVPIAQVRLSDGVITFLTTDLVGSVTATTDSSGVLVKTTDYSPYGEPLGARLSNFGYAGEWSDPSTGYSYLRARWYDPSTGSFLSLDPLVQSTSAAYSYTGGNPLTRIDPLGLDFFGDLGKNITGAVNNVGNFVKDAAVNTGKWVYDNSSMISGVTGVAAFAASLIPGGQPIALVLGVISAATGGIAAYDDTRKCVMNMPDCNYGMIALDAAGAITGGLAPFVKAIPRLAKITGDAVNLANLSTNISVLGIFTTGIIFTNQKIYEITKGQKC